MIKIVLQKFTLLFAFFLLHNSFAQMVNKGVVSVQPGTDNIVLSDFVNELDASFVNDGNLVYKGDFLNEGKFTFNDSHDGIVNFEGEEQQALTLNSPADFKHVNFDNSSAQPAFELVGDMYIFGEADFYQGIVNLNEEGGVFFDADATHINEYDGSHVDGVSIRFGESEFDFPVGDGSYLREASISSSQDANSIFSAKYFYEDSNIVYPHISRDPIIALIDNTEYWLIEKLEGDNNVVLTLSWDTDTTPGNVATLNGGEELHIVRWDDVSNRWIDEGGVVDTFSQTVSTPAQLESYGIFTLAKVYTSIDVNIYNAVSLNGDGKNDYLRIEGLDKFPNNTLSVFNRWGRLVYKTESYNTTGNVFDGHANVSTVISDVLPLGTYYYLLEFENALGNTEKKVGYLYIKDAN